MKQIMSITRKELEGYFGSLLSIIFLGAFLAVVLFVFFTAEAFFARGVADVRPLFTWLPILLIFLLAALTMRQWSEEQRSGTLEMLLTLPVKPVQLVLGKFLAVMILIVVALALTLPLPLTVSLIGNLDWGPVFGGYLAALLMAAAYAAIGLFVSSRTDNQIVALISTVLLGGAFYLVGTGQVTDFVGGSVADILWAIGTGSRFESIQRGVIDLRDLIYYLSLTGLFLLFNTLSLDSKRWSKKQVAYRTRTIITNALVAVNLLAVNVWMYPLQGLRLDLTAQKEFTISQTTRDLLNGLEEPLLIRGYISDKTHPLLAPLVPLVKDMLREYEIAGRGKVTAEVIDPLEDPDAEVEATQTYGIKPTPFQVSGRHESSVINSYFDILIRYGDQSVVLSFQDLIEVTQSTMGTSVNLRNLEYDLTRAIKKTVYGFQSVDSVLAALDQPVELTLYATQSLLPQPVATLQETVAKVAGEVQTQSEGKLVFNVVDPDAAGSKVTRQELIDTLKLQPYAVSLFSEDTFFFHLVLKNGEQSEVIYPTVDMTEGDVRTAIEAALKRTSTGFLKVVGVWTPSEAATQDMFGQTQQPLSSRNLIKQQLGQEYTVRQIDLSTGRVASDVDVLVVVAPENFSDKELFAIDQFLMNGKPVVIAANSYKLDADMYQGTLVLNPVEGGLKPLLDHYGVEIKDGLVMDEQNEPFPLSVERDVNGFKVQEIQAINYPYFVDIRSNGMDMKSPIVANLPAVTLSWVSPVELNADKNSGRETSVVLQSTAKSWLTTDTTVQPNFQTYPEWGFAQGDERKSYPLAVSVSGVFESYFKGKASPLAAEPTPEAGSTSVLPTPAAPEPPKGETSVIESSPAAARLVVIGSSEFTDDFVLNLSARISQDRYLNNLRLLQNAVDWSVEDLDMLAIRSRGSSVHVLYPLGENAQTVVEVINYILALVLLLGVYGYWQLRKRRQKPLLHAVEAKPKG